MGSKNDISIVIVQEFIKFVESSKNKKEFEIDLADRAKCDFIENFKELNDVVNLQLYKSVVHQELSNRILREHNALRESFNNFVRYHVCPVQLQYKTLADMFEVFVYENEGCLEHGGYFWGTSTDFHLMKRTLVSTPEYLDSIMLV